MAESVRARSPATKRASERRASQLEQLGAREGDARLVRAEIHEHGRLALHADDHAKAVLVVRHLIAQGIVLNRRRGFGDVEGACWQRPPLRGAGWLHRLQYALLRAATTADCPEPGEQGGKI